MGRGALDMKGMTAIEVMTMLLLKRNCVKLKGDVVLAATADEEQGGLAGVDYLLRNYPEKVLADYVLNEGGGLAVPVRGRNVYTVQTAEKGLLWFRVKANGVPGHGSLPHLADNAILRMNKVVETLGNCRFEVLFTPIMKKFLGEVVRVDSGLQELFSRLLANPNLSDQILGELSMSEKPLAEEIWPRIRVTITPTVICGGVKENVVPSECEAVFDCRILPGQNTAETFRLIKNFLEAAGIAKLAFEVIQANEPSESPMETPLYEVITGVLRAFESNCGVAPALMTGGTDSRFFRKMGSVCYGFHPMRPDLQYAKMVKSMHGVDERISVENLVFGTSVLYEVVKRFLG